MTSRRKLADLREEYAKASLNVHDVAADPIEQFKSWFEDAREAELGEPNAMVVATVDGEGRPSARVLLLKGVDERGFTFFTNYESRKGGELDDNPHVAMVFHWMGLERQVRIEGSAARLEHDESAAYFAQRPRGSQLGAWASPQSRMIGSRDVLEERLSEIEQRFGDRTIPCPGHWGGYLVRPDRVEFWQGRPNRLHDRIVYERTADDSWTTSRLAP